MSAIITDLTVSAFHTDPAHFTGSASSPFVIIFTDFSPIFRDNGFVLIAGFTDIAYLANLAKLAKSASSASSADACFSSTLCVLRIWGPAVLCTRWRSRQAASLHREAALPHSQLPAAASGDRKISCPPKPRMHGIGGCLRGRCHAGTLFQCRHAASDGLRSLLALIRHRTACPDGPPAQSNCAGALDRTRRQPHGCPASVDWRSQLIANSWVSFSYLQLLHAALPPEAPADDPPLQC